MALASEIEATSAPCLRDRHAIVGVGETPYLRGAGKTTRALATAAIRNASRPRSSASSRSCTSQPMLRRNSGTLVRVAVRLRAGARDAAASQRCTSALLLAAS